MLSARKAPCVSAETVVDFAPEHFQHMAGLVCYYNGSKYHYLFLSRDETHGRGAETSPRTRS